jgi:hypothetical protein
VISSIHSFTYFCVCVWVYCESENVSQKAHFNRSRQYSFIFLSECHHFERIGQKPKPKLKSNGGREGGRRVMIGGKKGEKAKSGEMRKKAKKGEMSDYLHSLNHIN